MKRGTRTITRTSSRSVAIVRRRIPLRSQRRLAVGAVVAVVLAVLFLINHFLIHHSLWDWLKLLIVPAVLAAGGLWFNAQQREREQRIAKERAQVEALQAYVDEMSQLLGDKDRPLLRAKSQVSLSTIARARTLTVLPRLAATHKRSVLQFLYESRLTDKEQALLEERDLIVKRRNIVDLSSADLRGADLSRANLIEANLYMAELQSADLRGANLAGSNLRGAHMTREQVDQAGSLARATLPGGDKYEELLKRGLLKSKGSGEDGKNSSP